jgi:hypothetical protein
MVVDIINSIGEISDRLAVKEAERQDELGKAILYWHQLRDIEVKIARLYRDTTADHTTEIEAIRAEWSSVDSLRSNAIAVGSSLPKPSNKEIAELVGIPEGKCGDVSQYLKRAREALRKKLDHA